MVFERWSRLARWCDFGLEGVMGGLEFEVFLKEGLAVLKRWVPRLLSGESSVMEAVKGAEVRGLGPGS